MRYHTQGLTQQTKSPKKLGYLIKIGFSDRYGGPIQRIIEHSQKQHDDGICRLIGLMKGADRGMESHFKKLMFDATPTIHNGAAILVNSKQKFNQTIEWYTYNSTNIENAIKSLWLTYINKIQATEIGAIAAGEFTIAFSTFPLRYDAPREMWFNKVNKPEPYDIFQRTPLTYFYLVDSGADTHRIIPNEKNEYMINNGSSKKPVNPRGFGKLAICPGCYIRIRANRETWTGLLHDVRITTGGTLVYKAYWDGVTSSERNNTEYTVLLSNMGKAINKGKFQIFPPTPEKAVKKTSVYPGWRSDGGRIKKSLWKQLSVYLGLPEDMRKVNTTLLREHCPVCMCPIFAFQHVIWDGISPNDSEDIKAKYIHFECKGELYRDECGFCSEPIYLNQGGKFKNTKNDNTAKKDVRYHKYCVGLTINKVQKARVGQPATKATKTVPYLNMPSLHT